MLSFGFNKEERLKRRKIIGSLFKKGTSIKAYPLKLIWLKTPLPSDKFPIQFTVTVPRRAFSKAVARNRLRRRIKESYRLNKHLLYQELEDSKDQFAFIVIYIARETMSFEDIDRAMEKIILRFLEKIKRGKA